MHAFRLAIVHTLHVSILLCRLTAAATQGPMLLSQKHREADFSDNASIEYAVFMLCTSFSAARRAPFLAQPSSRERGRGYDLRLGRVRGSKRQVTNREGHSRFRLTV